MKVKPAEIANLCAIYSSLGVSKISPHDLRKYLQRSMLIDSLSNSEEIIAQSVNYGFLYFKSGNYLITKQGRRLGKRQGSPSCRISDKSKEYFAKDILLNISSGDRCCGKFLLDFHVDTILNTFVYNRKDGESTKDTQWLILLNDVGLLDVEKTRALVKPEYLGVVNNLLAQMRDTFPEDTLLEADEKNKIGDIAEECALSYEKKRLEKKGYSDLAMLVQRISLVDKTAGYDILSYRGGEKNPDLQIYIEVKGTKKSDVCFIWSRNEKFIAERERRKYWIYCFINVKLEKKQAHGPIKINDPISKLESLGYNVTPLNVYVCKQ